MSAATKSEYSGLPKIGEKPPAAPAAARPELPAVVMAGPGDAPAKEIATELVDRAEIVNGTTLVKLSKSEQLAADIEASAKEGKFSMATTKDADATRQFRARCVKARNDIEKVALNMRRPLESFKKDIIAAERAIVSRIAKVEEPIDALIRADEKRRADERAAAEKLAAERNAHTDATIKDIVECVPSCVDQAATFIQQVIDWLADTTAEESEHFGRTAEVREAIATTRASVAAMHVAAVAREEAAAETVRLAKELAEREAAIAKREAIGKRIDEIHALPDDHVESTSEQLRAALASIAVLDPEFFGPRLREAQRAVAAVTPELNDLLTAAVEDEAHPDLAAQDVQEDDQPAELEQAPAEPAPAPAPAPVAERVQRGFTYVATGASAPAPAVAPTTRAASYTPVRAAPPQTRPRPSDDALIGALALHYRADEALVISWMREIDFDAAAKRVASLEDAPF